MRNKNWEGLLLKVTQIESRVASMNEMSWGLQEVLSRVCSTKHPHNPPRVSCPTHALGNTALPTWDWRLIQLQHCNKEQWYPASQHVFIRPLLRFIFLTPSYFPCTSAVSYHHHKPTLQSKVHLPFLMFHYQIYFQVCCCFFFLTCHDRTVSILFSSLPFYWSFFFLLFSLVFLPTSWRPSSSVLSPSFFFDF